MKNTSGLVLRLALGLTICVLTVAGCSKAPKLPDSQQVNGVSVDLPKLQQAFMGAPQDVASDVSQVAFGIRYGDYMKALAALDKLSNNTSITEAQKKVVNDVIEQVKKVMAQGQAPAGQ
jgi:hypothetical protein